MLPFLAHLYSRILNKLYILCGTAVMNIFISITGFISLDEFAEACELLQKHLPEHDTKEQLLDICKLMDINKDGLVDLNEFLETFRLCEQSKSSLHQYYSNDKNVILSSNSENSKGTQLKQQSTEEEEE
jgi:Ca2+-binding EF-hand superfamily protein